MPTRADQYADLLEKNQIVIERLLGTCPLDRETLLGIGVTGPYSTTIVFSSISSANAPGNW